MDDDEDPDQNIKPSHLNNGIPYNSRLNFFCTLQEWAEVNIVPTIPQVVFDSDVR